MAEDIVERLRSGAKTADTMTLAGVAHDSRSLEAADTIESLRAENERLRKALEQICGDKPRPALGNYDIARAALNHPRPGD